MQRIRASFDTPFEAMVQGWVPAGWISRYIDERLVYLKDRVSLEAGFRRLDLNLYLRSTGTLLVSSEPILLRDIRPLPDVFASSGLPFFSIDRVAPWTDEPGLPVMARMQGHMGVMRRRGKPIPPSIMARIVDREEENYEEFFEWQLLPLTLAGIEAYVRVLEKLGQDEDWGFFLGTLVPMMEGNRELEYAYLRVKRYLKARGEGVSARARRKIFRVQVLVEMPSM